MSIRLRQGKISTETKHVDHERYFMQHNRFAISITGLIVLLLTGLLIKPKCLMSAEKRDVLNEHSSDIFIINEDSSHFFYTREDDEVTAEGLRKWVDGYADSSVTHLFMCVNCQRANFRSNVKEAIWDPYDGGKDPTKKSEWPRRAKLLHERGVDPNAVRIARCRERGISPWLSIRMNDLHDVNKKNHWIHSSFWRNHPEYWRVPHSEKHPFTTRALDYAHKEVREYYLRFIREVLQRYDPDGIEIDWMRFGLHFAPKKGRENAPILTDFMRKVRNLTDKWSEKKGHPIQVAARVPVHPEAAMGLGMNGAKWAREGLIDLLIPAPFWKTCDYEIPLSLWRERMGDQSANVALTPGLEKAMRSYYWSRPVPNDLMGLYGFAASMQNRGADGVYLFNWMDRGWDEPGASPVSKQHYREMLQNGVSLKAALAQPRRYPVLFHDRVPSKFDNNIRLPVEGPKGGSFRIYIGPAPEEGTARLIVGLAGRRGKKEKIAGIQEATFAAQANNKNLSNLTDLTKTQLKKLGGGHNWWGDQHPARGLRFSIPLQTLRPGYNTFSVRQTSNGPAQRIVWVEFRMFPHKD